MDYNLLGFLQGGESSGTSSEDTSWLDQFDVDLGDPYNADDYSFLDDSWDTDLYGGNDQYDDFGLEGLFDDFNFNDIFSADDIDMDSDWWNNDSWRGGIEDDTSFLDMFDDTNTYGSDKKFDTSYLDFLKDGDYYEPETGPLGGTWGPWLNEKFTGGEGISGLLANILGGGGGSGSSGGNRPSGGILGGIGNMLGGGGDGGGLLDSTFGKLLLAKYLTGKDEGPSGMVPIGAEAFGAGGGQQPSYQIPNLQPALLPGMAYANQPTTFNNTPPGMQSGGIASLENRMEGPGDITQAMLEPGEFVMTRKATQNLTPEYLYDLMHQAENAGRMT
jgi:hypothetical protein